MPRPRPAEAIRIATEHVEQSPFRDLVAATDFELENYWVVGFSEPTEEGRKPPLPLFLSVEKATGEVREFSRDDA